VNSQTIEDFWESYRALPEQMRKQAQEAYRLFRADPFHPSLNFKEVDKRRSLWSVRVSRGYRALGYREGDTITWIWIGTHAAYDKLIAGR
jgi:hypothetical protein